MESDTGMRENHAVNLYHLRSNCVQVNRRISMNGGEERNGIYTREEFENEHICDLHLPFSGQNPRENFRAISSTLRTRNRAEMATEKCVRLTTYGLWPPVVSTVPNFVSAGPVSARARDMQIALIYTEPERLLFGQVADCQPDWGRGVKVVRVRRTCLSIDCHAFPRRASRIPPLEGFPQ